MQDWTKWRTTINDAMSDIISKRRGSGYFQAEREMLTSPTESKTPDFFLGHMSIHGQRVKDEYGGQAIVETDDTKTKIEKKIMEENFYLFGIPRISIRRSSAGNLVCGAINKNLNTHSAQQLQDSEFTSGSSKSSSSNGCKPHNLSPTDSRYSPTLVLHKNLVMHFNDIRIDKQGSTTSTGLITRMPPDVPSQHQGRLRRTSLATEKPVQYHLENFSHKRFKSPSHTIGLWNPRNKYSTRPLPDYPAEFVKGSRRASTGNV
jgi:hypothetical protein